ncbi:MAG: T9SS type A sorting domain-containing protein [Ignavibacteriales bacterium]|nr:T9SS type A sorting domain-containing protein [Ignavibacteriales bacterium]
MRLFIRALICAVTVVLNLSSQIENDECASATQIVTLPFSISQDTRLATPNNLEPKLICQDSSSNGKTVWFKYTTDTTRFVVFSTIGSQPSQDYDIIMSIFVGTCGNLIQIRCNDDTLDTRQSETGLIVQAGTTYYILIGEWGGGGTNGGIPTGGDLVFNAYAPILPPVVKGPKMGFTHNRVILSTDPYSSVFDFSRRKQKLPKPNVNKNIPKIQSVRSNVNPTGLYGSNYREATFSETTSVTISRPVVMKSFEGIPETHYVPPDPIIAAGNEHIIAAVNSTFRIFDKNGAILKTIDADEWFSAVIPNASTFDPIVMYDHFDDRWIFEMLHVDDALKKAFILLAVSDDGNPLGQWSAWALPANMIGDSTVQNWTDYARVGFDKEAMCITGNQFDFVTDFQYTKLRILPKAWLYSGSSDTVKWFDFWDFRNPDEVNTVIANIRPAIIFGEPGNGFLVNESPYFLGSFFTVWNIATPATDPEITGKNIPVVQYFPAKDANQKGVATTIESFGSDIRNEPVYRDSALVFVHTIASGDEKQYSALRYVKIDPFKQSALEDVAYGKEGFWFTYPAVMVDKELNMTFTFSRSGVDEYMGAYLAGRKKNDGTGLSTSIPIREGNASYMKVAGGRNRFGDYNGIALDPLDEQTVWTHTEFVPELNTWGTWITKNRMGPLEGVIATLDKHQLDFGMKPIGSVSDTFHLTLFNDGIDTLIISQIAISDPSFQLITNITFPVSILSNSAANFHVQFLPNVMGTANATLTFKTNAQNDSLLIVSLMGTGVQPSVIPKVNSSIPQSFALEQNYPNPFNPTTIIEYSIPKISFIQLKLFDVMGRLVRVLAEGWRKPGIFYEYVDVQQLSSGVYYYRLTTKDFVETKKMIIVK